MIKVTFNFHSCYTVELNDHILVFDYYNPVGKSDSADCNGDITLDNKKKIYFFASHFHADHFSRDIYDFKDKYDNVSYIISKDVRKPDFPVLRVSKREHYDLDDLHIFTLKSTDEGVAFVVEVENKIIYHAGDLNWWYWEENGPEYVKHWGDLYKDELMLIKDKAFDLAFVPVDSRMGKNSTKGLEEFLKIVPGADVVFPMHMWKNYSMIEGFINSIEGSKYVNRMVDVKKEGQEFVIEQ